jgi:4-amino-4-deoxy-L-arabinose transferase-like glycosyltransferase
VKLKFGFSEVWSLSLAIKIVLAILIPLSLDESYYWVWGQNPQLSYYDHPPMVGWLFFLGRGFDQ